MKVAIDTNNNTASQAWKFFFLYLNSLWGFYVRLPCSGIADNIWIEQCSNFYTTLQWLDNVLYAYNKKYPTPC